MEAAAGGLVGEAPKQTIREVFSGAKVVDSPLLNRLGAAPVRAVMARLLYKLRPRAADAVVRDLVRDGIATVPDFLPPDRFAALDREADEFMASRPPTWLHRNGTTDVRQYSLGEADLSAYPQLTGFRSDPAIAALVRGAERRRCRATDGGPLVEELTVGDGFDPMTELHVDTFFNTHKVWLYLDDIDERHCPFVYVPRSHRLDAVRLRHEYAEANGANTRSRRIADAELRQRGLEPWVVTCPKNTLVIANTCGYHARSAGEVGATRRSLHRQYRFDPFSFR